MFSFPKPSVYQTPKCLVTYGTMGHPNAHRLPTKTKPWNTLLAQDYVHNVDLILPESLLHLIKEKILDDAARSPRYHRVIMTLGQILEGNFFTQYIKIGNIMMLSEGKIGAGNVFSIKDGQLTMYIDRETYERVGLVGKPHGVKGARGSQPRWVVEYDLRSPSALHGKKGFDRLVYACKNALNTPTTWLFCNVSEIAPDPDPIAQYYPTQYTSHPALATALVTKVPPLGVPSAVLADKASQELNEYAADIYEWLSLVRLESPRVKPGDDIDAYLSTYEVPGDCSETSEDQLCKISWRGFIPPSWAANLLAGVVRTLPPKAWFSFSTTPFSRVAIGYGADCTIMRPPSSPGEYVLWEIKGHE
ncbi:ribonuclease P 40kDa subunit [Astrocystis sublimbata]|nr:ribonuclease P 40kDa subunit [Astrocystis sublimbata]